MNYAKRMGALLLVCVLMIGVLPSPALAEDVFIGTSTEGEFAVELNGTIYIALSNDTGVGLYVVPTDGGERKLLDSASELNDLVVANGILYYLRLMDNSWQIIRMGDDGALVVLREFEAGVPVDHLSWYDDVLYCLADAQLYLIDPGNGEWLMVSEDPTALMEDYAILEDVIFFSSATDQLTYEQPVSGQDEPLRITAGTLWSVSIVGTAPPEKMLDRGVSDLRAQGNQLFFHNASDNYRTISRETQSVWLEGKLYRYNVESQQPVSMNLSYDWAYFPTPHGVVVFTEKDVSLYPLTGGEKTLLMAPAMRASVTAGSDAAYVYEYGEDAGVLTKLPLDGSAPIVLSDDGSLPTFSITGPEDEFEDVDEGDSDDYTEADDPDPEIDPSTQPENSGYIFPNSSKKKLTRQQVLNIDKDMWGYARNEIWARHGYVFQKSKYKSYFSKKSWYKPGGFSTSKLNTIEWYNMELIKSLEIEYGLLEGTSNTSSSSNSSAKNNNYVLKEASSKKLTKKYIRNKLGSKDKYALARNEILARHGYVFKTAKYKKYFNNQKWYKPGGYSSSSLSSTEWHNIELLKELEKE